jgi:23S rRNA (adenine1618-N6)-methyltransferase
LNSKINKQKDENSGLHPLNKHHASYNFTELVEVCPELKSFVIINKFKIETIDFTNADAVKMLNKALLQKFYGITHWDIPKNYLCPPIPGRADYIHNIADLLSSSNGGIIPKGKSIRVLDIGVGANCIYPLIGYKEYGWYFVGSDSDAFSVKVASQIVSANDLSNVIDVRHQANALAIFKGIIKPTEII